MAVTSPRASSNAPAQPAHKPVAAEGLWLAAAFVVVHFVIGMAMRAFPVIGVFHAGACVIVGLVLAFRRPVAQLVPIVGYIVSSEVLWRMTRAPIFSELGKFAVIAILFVGVLRIRAVRNRGFVFGYIGLLLPSVGLTLTTSDLDIARQQISFNLAGPVALAVSVLFFSNVRVDASTVRRSLLVLLGPVVSVAAVAYLGITAATSIEFTYASNHALSGGFGPNQVSAVLGLGVLVAILLLLLRKEPLHLRVVLTATAVALAAQAALTFSRGGLVMAGIAILTAAQYLVRDRRTRISLVVVAGLMYAISVTFVVPRLVEFTSGKLAERYSDFSSTGRTELAELDLEIFADNPILGVGPGVATALRGEMGREAAAHTEYTRMLAEHGLLGALAILLLAVLVIRTIKQTRTFRARAFVMAMLVWSVLFFAVNATRLVAPAFLIGLACGIAYTSRDPTKAL